MSKCNHYADAGGVQHVAEHVVMTRLVLSASVLAMNDYNCTNTPGYCCLPRMTLSALLPALLTLAWPGQETHSGIDIQTNKRLLRPRLGVITTIL